MEFIHFFWHERWLDMSDTKGIVAKLSIPSIFSRPFYGVTLHLTFRQTLIIKIYKSILSPQRPGKLVHTVTLLVCTFRMSSRTPTSLTEGLVVFLGHFKFRDNILKLGHSHLFLYYFQSIIHYRKLFNDAFLIKIIYSRMVV
jgi:hypothetical protein